MSAPLDRTTQQCQGASVGVDRRGDMEVEVGVDPTSDQVLFSTMVIAIPFSSVWMARHLPGRRT